MIFSYRNDRPFDYAHIEGKVHKPEPLAQVSLQIISVRRVQFGYEIFLHLLQVLSSIDQTIKVEHLPNKFAQLQSFHADDLVSCNVVPVRICSDNSSGNLNSKGGHPFRAPAATTTCTVDVYARVYFEERAVEKKGANSRRAVFIGAT